MKDYLLPNETVVWAKSTPLVAKVKPSGYGLNSSTICNQKYGTPFQIQLMHNVGIIQKRYMENNSVFYSFAANKSFLQSVIAHCSS